MSREQRTNPWLKAAVPGALATVAFMLARLLAESAPPPTEVVAAVPAAPAGPASSDRLPELEVPAATVLDAPAGAEPVALAAAIGGSRSRGPRPGTERAHREAFAARLRQPDVDVDALIETTLRGSGPDPEKVGLLRALLDIGSDRALGALVTAAEEVEPRDGPHGAGVPEFCVRTLVERAGRDAEARAALGRLVRSPGSLDPRLRRDAAAHVALSGTASELAQLAADIRGCGDLELLRGVARSLELNAEAAVAPSCFTDLPAVAIDDAECAATN
jgi:hypothetical protein